MRTISGSRRVLFVDANAWKALRLRVDLSERLQARRSEIEQAILFRVNAISDPNEALDHEYIEGRRIAISAALGYCLATIERGEAGAPPLPGALLSQARLAARSGVTLDTMLRGYFAGYALLNDYLVGEVEGGSFPKREDVLLRPLLRTQGALFDRLLIAVSEEHAREAQSRPTTAEQRRLERVQRLLDGELVDASGLAYDFGAIHLGMVAVGAENAKALRDLGASLDRRILLIRPGDDLIWAWFSGRHPLDPGEVANQISSAWTGRGTLAFGECARGLRGWRVTHRQARAALPIALRSANGLAHYADVALLASAIQDDLLATSLHELYLAPLEDERDGGKIARATLRAYFAANRNVSSAAAGLGVSRPTVTNRLRSIEARLGRSIGTVALDIQIALGIEDLNRTSMTRDIPNAVD